MHDVAIPLEVRSGKLEVRRPMLKRHCEECRVNFVFRKNVMHDVAIPLEVGSRNLEVGIKKGSRKF